MYFTYFPKTLYSFDFTGSSPAAVTNIFSRFSFLQNVLNNTFAFYKYQIVQGDTPEIVATKLYGDPTLYWVICMTNNIVDPQFDFCLEQSALERKIIKQYNYSSIAEAYASIHHYELEVKKVLSEVDGATTTTTNTSIITLDQYNYTSNTLQTKSLGTANSETKTVSFYANNSNANSATVATLTITSTYKPVYVYDYENELNESKRQIKILKNEYIPGIMAELENVLNG